MSTVLNKHIIFLGNETPQFSELKSLLEARGAKILLQQCEDLNNEFIQKHQVGLIIYDHTNEDSLCENLKDVISTEHLDQVLPVFAIVEDSETKIQSALAFGLADYITPNESTESVLQKIETVFSTGEVSYTCSDIDITPIEADLSSTGIKVFIVEDDPLLRNLLSLRLDKSGFPYEFSKDGKDANHIIKQFKPDLIILDLMLPGISGFEVLENIKADSELKQIPVLVFSNKDGDDDRLRAKELGAENFYVKAMTDLSQLMESIEKMVNKNK